VTNIRNNNNSKEASFRITLRKRKKCDFIRNRIIVLDIFFSTTAKGSFQPFDRNLKLCFDFRA